MVKDYTDDTTVDAPENLIVYKKGWGENKKTIMAAAHIAVKVSGSSVICDEYLVEEMVKCCEENSIKYQLDVIDIGGTDAGAINRLGFRVKSSGISVAQDMYMEQMLM